MKVFLGFLLVLFCFGLVLLVEGMLALSNERTLAAAAYCPTSEISPSTTCLSFANGYFISSSNTSFFSLFTESERVYLWKPGVDPASCTSSCTLPPVDVTILSVNPFSALNQFSTTPDRVETWNDQVITIDEPNGTVIHTMENPSYTSPLFLAWGAGLAVTAGLILTFLAVNAGFSPLRFFNPFFFVEAIIRFIGEIAKYSGG